MKSCLMSIITIKLYINVYVCKCLGQTLSFLATALSKPVETLLSSNLQGNENVHFMIIIH